MDFRIKNFLQQLFSFLPRGEQVNYFFQRRISKSLPSSEGQFQFKINISREHYANFKNFNQIRTPSNQYFEFGAGWDLTVPLFFSQFGVECYALDIRKLAKIDLINHCIDRLNKMEVNNQETIFKRIKTTEDLKRLYHINYIAPCDARHTDFQDNSIDFSSSTFALEHIPPDDILLLLQETYRILKPGGILSMRIDYKDHWAYFDQSISAYNFLKYSKKEWNKYNPSLHYQSRMRHSDYIRLIEKSGFNVVKEEVDLPSREQEADLQALKIHSDYSGYHFEDLKILSSKLVLSKEIKN